MYFNVSPLAKLKIADLAKEGLILAFEKMEFMLEVIRNMQNREFTEVSGKMTRFLKHLDAMIESYGHIPDVWVVQSRRKIHVGRRPVGRNSTMGFVHGGANYRS